LLHAILVLSEGSKDPDPATVHRIGESQKQTGSELARQTSMLGEGHHGKDPTCKQLVFLRCYIDAETVQGIPAAIEGSEYNGSQF
jgi:hypothetical protein